MAYPDYSAFLPAESLYKEPGAYAGVLKAEALKRASYLSSMDQFYEQLRVSEEQFAKQYSLAEQEFEFGKEQSLWEREFKEESLETEKTMQASRLAAEREIARIGAETQRQMGEWQYELGLKELEFKEEAAEEELKFASEFLRKYVKEPTQTETAQATTFGEIQAVPYESEREDYFETTTPEGYRKFTNIPIKEGSFGY